MNSQIHFINGYLIFNHTIAVNMSNTESFLEYYEVIKSVIKPGFIGFDYSDRI